MTTCECWVDGALTRAIEKCPEMSGPSSTCGGDGSVREDG